MKIIDREFLAIDTPTCHASTIVFYKGEPVFAWFGGSREGMPDSSIYVQYKGKVRSLGTKVQMAYWNPILFTIEDELFLAYKVGKFCDSWQTYIINITNIDEIKDFDKLEKQVISAGLNFCVKTKPIVTERNEIYCGSSVETRDDWTSYEEVYKYEKGKFVFVERSMPLTIPKKRFKMINKYTGEKVEVYSQGIIQPSLWHDEYGSFHAFFRSSMGIGKIYYASRNISSWSDGEWTIPEPTNFKNPNSGIDTVYFNKRLFLVYNPSDKYRYPLVIRELDKGFSVMDEIVIREEVEGKALTRELSYPYLIRYNDSLHLTYTYGRSNIEYCVIKV